MRRGADARVRFLHLHGSPALLATLELLQPGEDGFVLDIGGPPDQVTARPATALGFS